MRKHILLVLLPLFMIQCAHQRQSIPLISSQNELRQNRVDYALALHHYQRQDYEKSLEFCEKISAKGALEYDTRILRMQNYLELGILEDAVKLKKEFDDRSMELYLSANLASYMEDPEKEKTQLENCWRRMVYAAQKS